MSLLSIGKPVVNILSDALCAASVALTATRGATMTLCLSAVRLGNRCRINHLAPPSSTGRNTDSAPPTAEFSSEPASTCSLTILLPLERRGAKRCGFSRAPPGRTHRNSTASDFHRVCGALTRTTRPPPVLPTPLRLVFHLPDHLSTLF